MRPIPLRPPGAARVPVLAALLIAGTAWLAGCVSRPSAHGSWAEGAPRDRNFQRVLVVGVSPSLNQRCPFERQLAGRISAGGTTAVASCTVIDMKTPLSREAVEAAIGAHQIDAVIATNLVSKQWELEEGGTQDTRGGGMYKATGSGYETGYWGAYGLPVIYGEFQTMASVQTLQSDVRVATRVFEARSARLLYSMDTRVERIESRDVGLHDVTEAIAERLRRDGLVQ